MSSRVQDLLTELHTSAVSNFTTDILLPNPTIGQAPSETVNEVSPKVIGAVIGGAVGCVLVLAIIIHLLLQVRLCASYNHTCVAAGTFVCKMCSTHKHIYTVKSLV